LSAAFDYPKRLRAAIEGMVREILVEVATEGFAGEHHLYLTFDTRKPDVGLPPSLASRYPESMTIVLQHQWADLEVGDGGFAVTLRFGGVWERLRVPFAALTQVVDPSVPFGLDLTQFAALEAGDDEESAEEPAIALVEDADGEPEDAETEELDAPHVSADVLPFRPR